MHDAVFYASLLMISFFCSCTQEPYVSRYMTVEDFNDANEFSSYVINRDFGYQTKCYRASTYYKYVLFDGHKKCSDVEEFCTESDSKDYFSPNSRCIKCKKAWKEHEKY